MVSAIIETKLEKLRQIAIIDSLVFCICLCFAYEIRV